MKVRAQIGGIRYVVEHSGWEHDSTQPDGILTEGDTNLDLFRQLYPIVSKPWDRLLRTVQRAVADFGGMILGTEQDEDDLLLDDAIED